MNTEYCEYCDPKPNGVITLDEFGCCDYCGRGIIVEQVKKNRLIRKVKRFFKTWTKEDWFGVIVMLLLVLAMFLLRFINFPTKVEAIVDSRGASEVMGGRGYEWCFDPIVCIRDIGELMERPNEEIREMVRIAKCESGYRPDAKNGSSTATGIFQILIGTWESNKCTGERTNFEDNIWCAWKIYDKRGNQPWVSSSGCWRE
jgi:hypothetical protein